MDKFSTDKFSTKVYVWINRRKPEAFKEGFRYYDEGVLAFRNGKPMNPNASRSWKDGYKDAKETLGKNGRYWKAYED